ncbi:bifunctional phosphoribosylaminoimidazolecarboxamide formyltransferase/IMP cyclohydrolase PurH [cyanobiont of Ornithocercus magnificus]|nr:bifunctional phosphoribosylaminoimidazolecarboxamide formyltransferase/IMP cyclohydrolase PurH [cyanobiont of Ornithocercus magnificus]
MSPTALLSVYDKQGVIPLAQALHRIYGFQLLSSAGTANVLEQAGLPVTHISDYTGVPSILGGRVKTLHPRIYAGILAQRDSVNYQLDLKTCDAQLIDIVVVNLYPFQKTVADPNASWADAIENIDIGGPALIRAAAKNHAHVSVLTSPDQYDCFLTALQASGASQVPASLRQRLAVEALEHTAAYDVAISRWMASHLEESPKSSLWLEALPLSQQLRYGENPHQQAYWYSTPHQGWGRAMQLQGKDLSANNLIDLDAALATVREFGYGLDAKHTAGQFAAVVVKHANPCGVAIGDEAATALTRALDADRTSAFGGIVALNSVVDALAANELTTLFLECIVAPGFSPDARKILATKPNLRLLELSNKAIAAAGHKRNCVRSILGGLLVQESDDLLINDTAWTVPSQRSPSAIEKTDLRFAWQLVRHVHSNAIVVARSLQSLGIGAGQMNRVGSARIALEAAAERAKGAVLASDGFFPFNDTVRLAADYGITAVIHPGGSLRDKDSISACDELGLAMILTGRRHFLH